jgi:hypothetical protein
LAARWRINEGTAGGRDGVRVLSHRRKVGKRISALGVGRRLFAGVVRSGQSDGHTGKGIAFVGDHLTRDHKAKRLVSRPGCSTYELQHPTVLPRNREFLECSRRGGEIVVENPLDPIRTPALAAVAGI